MNLMKFFPLLLSFLVLTLPSRAQEVADITLAADTAMSRPVTGVYALEIGHKNVLATYLSPLHYTGTDIGVYGEWTKAMPFSPYHWGMNFEAGADFASMLNPAETAKMIGLNAFFKWGMSWRTTIPGQVTLSVGPTFDIDGGCYYLMRNSNNPVQVMASVGLGLRAYASRPFKIGRLNFLLRDRVSLPSLSVFFSPQYGETYYEIYLGNHDGLVHAGWWGNKFRLDNLLSVTLDFGRTAMMLGYRFNADTQWVNNLNTRIFTHSFVIGVIPGGIGLKKKTHRVPATSVRSF